MPRGHGHKLDSALVLVASQRRQTSVGIRCLIPLLVFFCAPSAISGEAVAQRTLYTVNSEGILSTFAIQSDGSLIASSEIGDIGIFLRGIVISPDGKGAYVLDSVAATVLAFAVDEGGALTPIGAPVTVTDDAGCSDTVAFTGQIALCNGSAESKASRTIAVGAGL